MTQEQVAVRDASADLDKGSSLKVLAFAGAGKTTTLLEVAKARKDRGLYLAFNKSIADEAGRKFGATNARAATMHGLAFGVTRDFVSDIIPGKARCVVDSGVMPESTFVKKAPWSGLHGWSDYRYAAAVGRAVARFCASGDEDVSGHHARLAVMDSVGDPTLMALGQARERADLAIEVLTPHVMETANKFFDACIEKEKMSHDMYLKMADLVDPIRRDMFRRVGYVMIDEAQDLNPVQRSILEKSGVSIIAVGDPWQQIYSWRGAENALEKLPGESLYLTGSFRFGENIAETARQILETRPDGGPDHDLRGLGGHVDLKAWEGPKGAVICRTNAGVVEAAMSFMEKGHSVSVDNFEQVVLDVKSAIALHAGNIAGVKSETLKRYLDWSELEIDAEDGSDPQISRLRDLVVSGEAENVLDVGRRRTKDASAEIMVCTAHRSKGMEWPAVRLWGDFKPIDTLNARHAKAAETSPAAVTSALEEWNTLYVGYTRGIKRATLPISVLESLNIDALEDSHDDQTPSRAA